MKKEKQNKLNSAIAASLKEFTTDVSQLGTRENVRRICRTHTEHNINIAG